MDTARAELADKMNKRRLQLGIRWNEVARRAGMSVQNLSRIRRGEITLTEDAAAGIERALQFAEGSVMGGDPAPTDERSGPPPLPESAAAKGLIVAMSREELAHMADAYAEAFGSEAAGEEFLLRAYEIRRAAATADEDGRTSGSA